MITAPPGLEPGSTAPKAAVLPVTLQGKATTKSFLEKLCPVLSPGNPWGEGQGNIHQTQETLPESFLPTSFSRHERAGQIFLNNI